MKLWVFYLAHRAEISDKAARDMLDYLCGYMSQEQIEFRAIRSLKRMIKQYPVKT